MKRSILLSVFLGLALSFGCDDKKGGKQGQKAGTKKKKPTTPQQEPPLSAKEALSWVPADAQTVFVIIKPAGIFQLVQQIENATGQRELGRMLINRAKMTSGTAPIPVPWTLPDFEKLGVDGKASAVLFGRSPEQGVAMIGVKDQKALRSQLALLATVEKVKHDGRELLKVTPKRGERGAFCSFSANRLRCSEDRQALVAALKRPKKSLWSRLSPAQQKSAAAATALFFGHKDGHELLGTFTAEPDGVSLRAAIKGGVRAAPILAMLGAAGKGAPKLLGLAKGAGSVLQLRLPLALLLQAAAERGGAIPPPALAALGKLTGEIVAFERQGKLALVAGAASADAAQQLVETLGATIAEGLKKPRGAEGPKIKLRRRKLGGRKAFLVSVKGKAEKMPIDFEIGLAATPLGLALGSWSLLEQLAPLTEADPAAFRDQLTTAAAKAAFADDAIVGLTLALSDPLAAIADKLPLPDSMPPQAKSGLELGRFLFDQLHQLTIGQSFTAPNRIDVVLRLTTLHRAGQAGDDKARDAWYAALKKKYAGDQAGFEADLAALAKAHPGTRYAERAQRGKGTVAGVAVLGIGAAIAIPAFVKYIRRSKASEARANLRAIAAGAKAYYATHKRFPTAEGKWTPAGGCCSGPRKRCAPAAAQWSATPWKDLAFALSTAHYYQYRYAATDKGKGFVAEARGDLDCDGKQALYRVKGTVKRGKVRTEHEEQNPLE